jgi:hypothetical protein
MPDNLARGFLNAPTPSEPAAANQDSIAIVVAGGGPPESTVDPKTGAISIELPDGSVQIHLGGLPTIDPSDGDFHENLADKIGNDERGRIVEELLMGIDSDDQSRQDWLKTRAIGIEMLGFKLEEPRTDSGGSAPLEGMSVVRHTLLPEAVIRFQANSSAELLPANGPVKVRDDRPQKPLGATDAMTPPSMGHNGGPALDDDEDEDGIAAAIAAIPQPQQAPQPPPGTPGTPPDTTTEDQLAEALEKDFNHYLTVVDKAYRADTVRMLFDVGFGGCAFKKVYNCPIKQRPVSRSVDAKDLIVSNDICDLEDAGRITHRVRMRKSLVKRMMMAGAYRDIELSQPSPEVNDADQAVADAQGFSPTPQRVEDYPYIIDECYCELDIKGLEHKKDGKPTGLSLPYKASIERSSRQLLELRRNWREGDETHTPLRVFVKFDFVCAMGFYSIGLLHILGNADRALTAAWREMLDAGMFASFPGFLYSKQAGRQLTNEIRVPPGGGMSIETGGQPITSVIMPLPYKDPGPAMLGLIQHIEEMGQRIGGTAELPVGEGQADAPVGTTLALIEQATKVLAAVHVGLHASQSQEFQLLKERFQEDPEAFWRFNRRPTRTWEIEVFLKALDDYDLVPAADPNTASHMHRIMKAVAVKQLQAMNPQLYDAKAVDTRILSMIGFSNPQELFAPPQLGPLAPGAPPAVPTDPNKMAALQLKGQQQQQDHAARMAELELKGQEQAAATQARAEAQAADAAAAQRDRETQAQMAAVESADRAADRASRERVAEMRLETEKAKAEEQENATAARTATAKAEKQAEPAEPSPISVAVHHAPNLGTVPQEPV